MDITSYTTKFTTITTTLHCILFLKYVYTIYLYTQFMYAFNLNLHFFNKIQQYRYVSDKRIYWGKNSKAAWVLGTPWWIQHLVRMYIVHVKYCMLTVYTIIHIVNTYRQLIQPHRDRVIIPHIIKIEWEKQKKKLRKYCVITIFHFCGKTFI